MATPACSGGRSGKSLPSDSRWRGFSEQDVEDCT
jgi:hypothetical protein